MAQVTYKNHPIYLGYRIGDDGTVWSCWGTAGRYKPSAMTETWKQMKPTVKPDGRHYVNIKKKACHVHTLVLETFVGPKPDGQECRHFPDRDLSNNRLENLSWGSHQANIDDKNVHGTVSKGEHRYNSKLTEEAVRDIRSRYADNIATQTELGKEYGVHQSVVCQIISRKRWAHVA